MSNSEKENVGSLKRCWQCNWRFSDHQLREINQHTCFRDFEGSKHEFLISKEGVVSFRVMNAAQKRFVQEIEVIEEVRKRPCLYQRKYNVSTANKEKIWEEIKKIVAPDSTSTTTTDIKQMWRNVRDQFRKAPKVSIPNTSKFRHYDRMRFLQTVTDNVHNSSALSDISNVEFQREDNISSDSLSAPLRGGDEESLEQNEPSETEPSSSCSYSMVNDTAVVQESNMRKKGRSSMQNNKKRTESLQQLVLEKIRTYRTEQQDPVTTFLGSLKETISRLSPLRQLTVRRRFMEVLEEEYVHQLAEEDL